MKLGKCEVKNFGSYESLTFDFSDLGLSLVHGPTGAGKSTLFDMASWVLFGVTAKNGSVDEVRSWTSQDEPTEGTLHLTTQSIDLVVHRVRGAQAQNDLYFRWADDGIKIRGKDLKDTQALLEAKLGVTSELYLAGCYFNEFSSVAAFFTSTAKNRRALLDLIADTKLADSLMLATAADKKKNKPTIAEFEKKLLILDRDLNNGKNQLENITKYASNWDLQHSAKITEYTTKRDNFEVIKQSKIEAAFTAWSVWSQKQDKKRQVNAEKRSQVIEEISQCNDNSCPTCGKSNGTLSKLHKSLQFLENESVELSDEVYPIRELEAARAMENEYQKLIEEKQTESNPFSGKVEAQESAVRGLERQLNTTKDILSKLLERTLLIDDLQAISNTLRGELIKRSIKEIQDQSNTYLERFFDSEIRITLSIPGSDSVEVEIKKNGFDCVYSQLSKGQRGLLKLCFSLSVMKSVSNKAGVHFDSIFLDESLDGLDANLKIKAFSLLSELSNNHSTVLVIDHSTELQSCFPRKFSVELEEDESYINES